MEVQSTIIGLVDKMLTSGRAIYSLITWGLVRLQGGNWDGVLGSRGILYKYDWTKGVVPL